MFFQFKEKIENIPERLKYFPDNDEIKNIEHVYVTFKYARIGKND